MEIDGVKLSLSGVSAHMRYVMHRGYERRDARMIVAHLDPNDRVLELGSAIGFTALVCLKRFPSIEYFMVEANPALLPMAKENFDLNGVPVPGMLNVMVGPKDGLGSFGIGKDFWSSSPLARDSEESRVAIKMSTVETILKAVPFTPNVLIMDVEGSEISIEVSSLLLFEKVAIEFHPKLTGALSVESMIANMTENGFDIADRNGGVVLFRKRTR